MKPNLKKVLKWIGIVVGSLILCGLIVAIYIWSLMPKPMGEPPILQTDLFQKPKVEFPCEGEYS